MKRKFAWLTEARSRLANRKSNQKLNKLLFNYNNQSDKLQI